MLKHDILQDFFSEQKGQIVCITDDLSLFRSLRYAIGAHTQVPDDLIHFFSEPEAATQILEELHKDKTPTIVLVERKIEGEKNTDMILRISRLYPTACMLVVGSDITKDMVAYFYEIGAKAVISKPVSADAIFSKLTLCLTTSKEQHLKSYVWDLIASASSEEALEAVETFIVNNPNSCLAYSLKGDALLANGDLLKAQEAYEHANEINPYFTEPLKRLAALHKHIDDNKALELLQKVDRISPFNPNRKLEMAEIHLRKDDTAQATLLLEKGFKQASQEFSLFLGDMAERISALVADKIPHLAEEYLEKAMRVKKNFTLLDIHMFNKLGIIYRNKGNWKEAVEVYKKALDITPKDPALYYNMALAYHDGAKRDEVRRCFNKAFDLDPVFYRDNAGVAYNIGSIYLGYGDKDIARPFLEHVLEIQPDNKKAKEKLKRCGKD
ncbi:MULTISPECIES: tetratricopeptide repeat protein [unclassified Pseudodesulfovibrio]|uniref:tetratricopeptide repeat protein n=1 Tax=unclassified Pseudodesulfovibrio TaxID=2661612 RepID=UPI000FEBB74B|nr:MULTISPECIES: tetratricopeptide repeat protein [unclassified Pseudodesulfovibrio]MCJ2165702.1 tetratricopeptide repeat protein [Pseudodesulfovibrio sp. S3-i]RWU02963.1 tetratricopeptide repeat protein [Pseudodesulfovibrio sp. S3]